MKKLLSILALALCFVACQNEGVENATNGDLANVVLTVDAPELDATRADGDANTGKNSAFGAIDFFDDADWANFDLRYILEVYDANDKGTGEPIYRERLVECVDKYTPVTFDLRLVPNREYKFVVFADFVEQGSKEDLYYDTTDFSNITAKTDAEGWNAMNEVRDAYFVSENVEVQSSVNKELKLTRPFGKVRVIATDLDYIAGYSTPGYVEVTYSTEAIYKSFNAINGNLNDTLMTGEELTYGYTVSKNAPYTEGYDAEDKSQTLFADYLLAPEGQQMPINFKMAVYESKGGRMIKETEFKTQIPVQRNYLTTIVGDILTTQANITIVVNDDFKGELDGNATIESVAAPVVTATAKDNTVTLTWDAVEGAAMYFVRNANDNTTFEETTELSKVYENLAWETEYKFEVYAMSENGIVSDTVAVKATTGKAPVEEPEGPVASEWGVVGDITNWGGSDDIVMYTTSTENLFVAEKVDIKSGSIKIRANKQWNDAKNYGFEVAGKAYADKYYAVITGSGSQNMTPIEYGVYDVYFDLANKRVALMTPGKAYAEAEDGGAPVVVVEGLKEHEWGLVGSFNNWDVANYVVTTVQGDWAVAKNVALAKNAEFKFAADKAWTLSYGTACDVKVGETYQAKNNGGNMKYVGEAGNFDFYFSLVDAKFYMTEAGAEVPAEPEALATPVVAASVEGNVVTLTWETIENAGQYGITVGTEMPVFVEDTTYVFTGEYETEYTFNVVAVPADDLQFAVSEAAVVTATTEAAPVVGPTYTTVAEFLAAAEDESATATMYTLKGTITAVANETYGNFDLTDDTGTVYIYGLMSPDGATNKYWATSGAKLGDDIVIKTVRTSFNGTAQGKNAWFVELVSPGTRAFYTVDPAAVDFASAGGNQDIEVYAYNTTAGVTATSDNAAFTVAVNGYVVTVTAAANELEEAVTGNITIKVGDLEPTVVKATIAAKPASGAVEGGSDDFHTISATNTSYVSGKTTAGWNYKNCAIFKGGTSDSSPAFKMIGDAANRALCMNGKTSAVGSITSPTINTGCGTLKFNYGLPFGDTKIKFRVDIMQDGAVVKTFTVDKSSATKLTLYSHEETINVAGDFQIVFTNLSPSNSTSNKDRTAIWDVEWTGYNN